MADPKEDYSETIRQLVPAFSLAPQYQTELIQRSSIVKLQRGKYLFKQGDRDDYSFYLLAGEIEMQSDGRVQNTIRGGSDSSRYPLAQLQPRQLSARAKTTITVLQVNRNALDNLLLMEQDSSKSGVSTQDVEVSDIGSSEEDIDWMTRLLQSEIFSRLPNANIHQLFTALEATQFEQGDQVIRQGDPGDYYYIIQSGRCELSCRSSDGTEDIVLAELGPGDGFGEEVLLANATRNASVRMLTAGVLMRMDKDHFLELIKKPALGYVTYDDACSRLRDGAELIDIRQAEEFEQSHIGNSRNVPLTRIRTDSGQLPLDREYIVYCDSGDRSSVAAFLLTQRGYNVSYLEAGLMNCPSGDMTRMTADNQQQPDPPTREPAGKLIEPDVRASAYDAQLAVAEHEMQAAEDRQSATAPDDDKRAEYEAMVQQLREEHAQLQAAKERANAEAQRAREQEEARIAKLREDAVQQLKQQKEKLQQVYAQNTRQMEKLKSLKQQAEEQVRHARAQAQEESAEARRRMQEADSLKQQFQHAKSAIEKEADTQRARQAEMEQKIQAEAERKLEAERKNLADQYQRSSEALEEAQREKAAAEAARAAAQDEAKRIIEEFKQAHARTRAEEEARLQAERERLEQQSQELRESMESAKNARQEAEAVRQNAETQLAKLRIKLAQNNDKKDGQLQQRIKAAEAEASQARDDLAQAEKVHEQTQTAQQNNIRELAQQNEEEKQLREQIESEVSEWLNENDLQSPSGEELEKQAEHMRRIKERAEQAKRESQHAAQNLMDDIADQLGKD